MFERLNVKKLTLSKIFLSVIFLIVFWEVCNIIGWNGIFSGWKNFYGNDLYADLKRIIFCIPCLVLIKYYNNELKISIGDMFRNFDLKLFLKWFFIILSLELATMFIIHKKFNMNYNNIFTLLDNLLIGFSEEFVFRGWIFNALYSKINYKKANILQSLIFTIFHWVPFIVYWTISGSVNISQLQYVMTWNTLFVFLFGLIFGHLFKKTKSLVFVSIIHTLIDYLAVLFYMN